MFRVVVVVGIAMVPVIVLALAIAPLAGAILLAVEAGAAIGYLLQRWRAARAAAPPGGEEAGR